jgi:phage terminase small subunit
MGTMRSPTKRQTRFVDEYMVDLNATRAAIRAGYSVETAYSIGHELLKKPEVAAAIAARQAERASRTSITADRVLQELARIGFADIRDIVRWTAGDGISSPELTVIDSSSLCADDAAAISEVSQAKDGSIRVKLHDKRAALVDIGRHLGMFVDRHELAGKGGAALVPKEAVSPRQLAKELMFMVRRAALEDADPGA